MNIKRLDASYIISPPDHGVQYISSRLETFPSESCICHLKLSLNIPCICIIVNNPYIYINTYYAFHCNFMYYNVCKYMPWWIKNIPLYNLQNHIQYIWYHLVIQSIIHLWKLTWHWKIPIFNRKFIFKWWLFHCHLSFQGHNLSYIAISPSCDSSCSFHPPGVSPRCKDLLPLRNDWHERRPLP